MTAAGQLLKIAQQVLRALIETSAQYEEGRLTRGDIWRHAELAAGHAAVAAGLSEGYTDVPTVEQLVGWAEMHFNVRQDEAARLQGDEAGHVPWVSARRAELFPPTGFWNHYRELLEMRLPPGPMRRLDIVTDEILDQLEDPSRPGQWDRRGLVMGQVQSGKTNNYLGLAAKGADAGYRLIVILAGVHNNLRAQTQHRMDEAVIGRDTREGERSIQRFGVGLKPGHPPTLSMTSAADQGDFKKAVADHVGNPFADIDHPTVFVIKKHVSILENLHSWLVDNSSRPAGHERISEVPLLLIDDEADNASIDTAARDGDEEVDPTRTNRGIRRILNLFDQSAYVGYTATPFANVFIDDEGSHTEFGDDLFPRDFIFALEAPSNYVGPSRVFGIADPGSEDPRSDDSGLPMVTRVNDTDNWLPVDHKSDFRPPDTAVPKSLKRAVGSFVLACAARLHRGQLAEHNSMLVHVTRFTEPQNEVRRQVEDLVVDLRNEILYGTGPETWRQLEHIWNTDFVPAARALSDDDDAPPVHRFEEIRPHVGEAVSAIKVRAINGTSADVLDYADHEATGLSVIVIGGAKLSRGLTLEGLTVSYYLRATRMYDTLMQMGRWFGYRPGYLDLCRIYTAPEVVSWYRNIALATEELLADFRTMQEAGGRPKDFGLRVRHSPGMMITSNVKMRSGVRRSVNFGLRRPEVTSFETEPARRTAARVHLESFVEAMEQVQDRSTDESGNHSWRNVPASVVISYLAALSASGLYPHANSARPGYLVDYVRRRNTQGGLVDWTVLLKSNSQATDPQDRHELTGGISVGMSRRTDRAGIGRYAIKSLIGSADEAFDLTPAQLDAATAQAGGGSPTGRHLRQQRPTSKGLLILYLLNPRGIETLDDNGKRDVASHIPDGDPFAAFCMSMPEDPDNTLVEYVVNNVFEHEMKGAAE